MQRFSIRQLLLLTVAFAVFFALRAWAIAIPVSSPGGLIAIVLATTFAVHCGLTQSRLIAGGLFAAAAGMVSATAIVTWTVFTLSTTNSERFASVESQQTFDVQLNAINICAFTLTCFLGGIIVCWVVRIFRVRFDAHNVRITMADNRPRPCA